jgi:uncharacterized membrane protein
LPFDATGHLHGFLDSRGTFTSIDVLGASNAAAYSINAAGQIVGGFFDATGEHGFLEAGNNIILLDFPGASGTEADGINAAGQIVGAWFDSTGNVHGFVATAVPEPATLVMFGTGIVCLASMIRRKPPRGGARRT